MDKWKVTITKEDLERLFMLDESEFCKAVDKLCEEVLTSYHAHLIIKYLKGKGLL